MAFRWFALAWLAVGVWASSEDVEAQALPSYLKIDGRYYAAGPSDYLLYPQLRALVVTDTVASNCRRANGAPVTPAGSILFYGPNVVELQVRPPMRLHFTGHRTAEVSTVDGDVVCDGEVPPPVIMDPNRVFDDGFEPGQPAS